MLLAPRWAKTETVHISVVESINIGSDSATADAEWRANFETSHMHRTSPSLRFCSMDRFGMFKRTRTR